jgi:putative ABC transport system permease protein
MKFLGIIFANLRRKKMRLLLTIGSFAISLFLFGLLAVVRGAFHQGIDIAGADRLIIINRTSIIQPLPLSYRDRIARIPGISHITYATWFGGVYKDERNFFPQLAVDKDTYREVYPEFVFDEDQWNAFLADREGAFAGADIAKRFGWKIGDRIPFKSAIFRGQWEFNLRGIYHGKRPQDDTSQFWFRWDRLEEQKSADWKGRVGWYVVRVANPDEAAGIARRIDDMFSNSPDETKTETERSFAAGWVKQIGNIELLILSIGGVVFFTLLLVTGNTMAIAVRERTNELAILKAIGYSDTFVLILVLIESMIIAAIGGVLGLALAKLFTLNGDPTRGMLPYFFLPVKYILLGMAAAIAVGVASGLLPAIGASRMRVVDALRRV